MLYVSRYIGVLDIGIVDTDDGVEERVSPGDIIHDTVDYSIDIKGYHSENRILVYQPYQLPETKTQQQLKLQLLKGVEVVVWGSMITNIRWKPDKIKSPVSIRLSDFGTSCGDFILKGNEATHTRCIRLVFDDKLEPPEIYSVTMVCPPGVSLHRDVLYDLSDVTSEKLVESVYRSILVHRSWNNKQFTPVPGEVIGAVLDDNDRKHRMIQKLVKGSLWR